MQTLSDQAASGEIELAYLDEVGFSGVHPNRSAWTECGKCQLVKAKRCKRLIRQQVGKPLTVILDNASIHTAKSIAPLTAWLVKHGVTLYFLPTYSPELNRIERMWHKIKYTWIAVKCRTAKGLEADVGHILDNFGTTYKFDFYSS